MRSQLLIFVGCVVCVPIVVHAQVAISEIMYDLAEGSDSGHEWIEIFNAGNASVKVTDLRVIESGKSHTIKAVTGGDSVATNSYAVIADNAAKFKSDWPNYSGQLFDSAFSLSNSGETISIADGKGNVIDSVSYTSASANGTGDSLQRSPSSTRFDAGIPTPGAGIPASGLNKSPPKQSKSSKKTVAKNLPPTPPVNIIGDATSPPSTAFVAAAAASPASSLFWWLAPLLLAIFGSAGIVTARHYKKSEWDIVEEIEETS